MLSSQTRFPGRTRATTLRATQQPRVGAGIPLLSAAPFPAFHARNTSNTTGMTKEQCNESFFREHSRSSEPLHQQSKEGSRYGAEDHQSPSRTDRKSHRSRSDPRFRDSPRRDQEPCDGS